MKSVLRVIFAVVSFLLLIVGSVGFGTLFYVLVKIF